MFVINGNIQERIMSFCKVLQLDLRLQYNLGNGLNISEEK